MVEKDPGNEDGPSLEMPKLGFGFLRRRKQEDQAETAPEAEAETEAEEPTAEEPAAEEVVADQPEAPDSDPDTIFDEDDEDDQVTEDEEDAGPVEDERPDVVTTEEPELADAPPAADTPVVASPAEDLEREEAAPTPEATSLTKTPDAPSDATEEPDPDAEATTVLTDVPEADADEATEVLTAAETEDQDEEAPAPAAKPERTVSLPALSGLTAAAVTGVAVGLLAVLLTYVALRGCEQAQGTSSCGGPGLFLLIAIMVICVLAGRFLLAAWDVTDPGSTSFLAVGLLAVIALLFLVNVLFEWWMIILIPLIGLATYMLSHWVTTALIEPADRA